MRNLNLPLHKVKLSMVHRQHAGKHNINVYFDPKGSLDHGIDDLEEVPGELGLVVKGVFKMAIHGFHAALLNTWAD